MNREREDSTTCVVSDGCVAFKIPCWRWLWLYEDLSMYQMN